MPKKNNSQEYWAKRRQQDKIKVIKEGEKGIDNLKRLLKVNLDDVQAKIKSFYEKYGENPAEKMSYSEWQKYKAKLKRMAQQNPQDEFLQRLAKQNIPKYQVDRLRALELDLQMQLTEATNGQAQGIYNTLDDVARVSQSVLAKSMQASIGLKFNTIADRKLKQLLSSDWSGANWSDRLWHDRAVVGKKVTEILQKGVTQGTSLQKMARELKQTTNQSFNNAFRLIRTETSFIDSQVTFEGYEQARRELGLEYYMYDAFLDNRTSAICREMDGKYFKIAEKQIGVNAPPLHPSCRSTTQLVLDDEDMKEPVKELTEFKDFGKFNRKAYGLADFVKSDNLSKKEQISFARKFYDKNTLNSFYSIGKLNKETKELLGSKTDNIKFSIDSMIKNRIEHPDLNFYNYKKIEQILASPDKIQPSKKKNHIVIIKEIDNKPYQLVLKTTENKKENFVVSFHRCD
jgi:SPP1 gp7 family putative phage head morphogenesis protein